MPFTREEIEKFAQQCEAAEISTENVYVALRVLKLMHDQSVIDDSWTRRREIEFLQRARDWMDDRELLIAAFS